MWWALAPGTRATVWLDAISSNNDHWDQQFLKIMIFHMYFMVAVVMELKKALGASWCGCLRSIFCNSHDHSMPRATEPPIDANHQHDFDLRCERGGNLQLVLLLKTSLPLGNEQYGALLAVNNVHR